MTAAAPMAAGKHSVMRRVDGGRADGPEDRGLPDLCLVGISDWPPLLLDASNKMEHCQTPNHIIGRLA